MSKRLNITVGEYELECLYTAGRPAKTYGPPENCHPEDPAEIEICAATLEGEPLSDHQIRALEESDKFYEEMLIASNDVLVDEYEAHQEFLGELRRERLQDD